MIDAVEQAVRARQPEYPPEQSMSGQNTYTIGCNVLGYSPGYCVCLHKIAAHKRDGDIKSHPECSRAISNGSCPAVALREEEVEAGKALYFIHRELLREEMDKHFATINPAAFKSKATPPAKTAPVRTSSPAVTPKKSESPLVHSDADNGYAAAINAAIREAETQPEKPKQEEVSTPSPSPVTRGPSMLELARMRMGKTSQGE